jgi:hypothetical protein
MCLVAVAAFAGLAGVAESARGPAVQLTSGENAAVPQPVATGTAVTRSGRQLVLWSAAASDGANARVWGRVVEPGGAPAGERFAVSGARPDGTPVSASGGAVAARGRRNEFLVTWIEESDDGSVGVRLMARRFTSAGGALAQPFVVASGPRFLDVGGGAVAYGGGRQEFVVVFRGREQAGYASYAARVRAGSATVSKAVRISSYRKTLLESSGVSSVAYDLRADRFLATWAGLTGEVTGNADRDVYARTLPGASSGRLGQTWRISPPATSGELSIGPDVAYNHVEREFAATWTGGSAFEDEAIYARRIGPDGRPRGPAPLVDGGDFDGASHARIEAAPGGHYLVTYNRSGPREDDQTVLARRVGPSLKVRAPRSVPTSLAERATAGGVAYSFAARRFVVTWAETRERREDDTAPPPKYDIFARGL